LLSRKKINRPIYESDMLRGNSPGRCLATSRINAGADGAAVHDWTSFRSNTRIEYYITAQLELQGIFKNFFIFLLYDFFPCIPLHFSHTFPLFLWNPKK